MAGRLPSSPTSTMKIATVAERARGVDDEHVRIVPERWSCSWPAARLGRHSEVVPRAVSDRSVGDRGSVAGLARWGG